MHVRLQLTAMLLVTLIVSGSAFGVPVSDDIGSLAPEPNYPQPAPTDESKPTAIQPAELTPPSAEDAYPYPPNIGYLNALPALDTRVTSPPVVFLPEVVTSANEKTTATLSLYSLLFWHLNTVSQGRMVLNVLPQYYTTYPYQRENDDGSKKVPARDLLLGDARKIGAHYYIGVTLDETPAQISIGIFAQNVKTGISQEWKQAARTAEFQALMSAALQFITRSCGIEGKSDTDAILAGIPRAETWQALSATYSRPVREVQALAQADPNCLGCVSRSRPVDLPPMRSSRF